MWREKPQAIGSDNGPEFVSAKFIVRAEKWGIRLEYIQLGNRQGGLTWNRVSTGVAYRQAEVLTMEPEPPLP